MPMDSLKEDVTNHLAKIKQKVDSLKPYYVCGYVTRIVGLTIEVKGINAPVGSICRIVVSDDHILLAEIIGFSNDSCFLMSYSDIHGVRANTKVYVLDENHHVKVGPDLLGRMIDALGHPIDHKGEINYTDTFPLNPQPINPLERKRITDALDVGVKAINCLVTACKGQRLGIFAESGIGKSVLLGMMTHFTKADVVVVGLIGERGREVKEFIEEIIGDEGMEKTVILASPSDTSPLLKVHAAARATSIAEYFRAQDKDVLLIIDSVTRYAQALREISLASGEMPTTKGYTTTVFAKLASLVERTGTGKEGQGSVTAFYTVLIDKDDMTDPVGDHVKSLIDGHIILSRDLAEQGHYPAIDIDRSISRVMPTVVSTDQQELALALKKLYSVYMKNKDLINIGMYQQGADPLLDKAIAIWPHIQAFLTQRMDHGVGYQDGIDMLRKLLTTSDPTQV